MSQLEKLAEEAAEPGGPERHPFQIHIHPTVHIHASSLSGWQHDLAAVAGAVAGVLVAAFLINRLVWLAEIDRRRRNARFAACYLGIWRAHLSGDTGGVAQFSTEQFVTRLERDAHALGPGDPPLGEPSIEVITTLKGGRRRDRECLARIEAVARITQAGTIGPQRTGADWGDNNVWRFVRSSRRRWITTGIDPTFSFPSRDLPFQALGARPDPKIRAAVLLHRPDELRRSLEWGATSVGGAGPLRALLTLSEPLRRPVEGATAALPGKMLLRLTEQGTLHLFQLDQEKGRLKVGGEVACWPAGGARLSVCTTKRAFHPVEIAYSGGQVLLAAAWRRERAALRTIEEATAAATETSQGRYEAQLT
jgi:hypothetical protein